MDIVIRLQGLASAETGVTTRSSPDLVSRRSPVCQLYTPAANASPEDSAWVPSRFANLSNRPVTANGIFLMGLAAGAAVVYTGADVGHLVVMYSINVFVTFTLSQSGMVRHWWQVRRVQSRWLPRLLLNGAGMLLCAGILTVNVALKFFQGGWVTVAITGSFVLVAFLVRRHYRRFKFATTMLNLLAEGAVETLGRYRESDLRCKAIDKS